MIFIKNEDVKEIREFLELQLRVKTVFYNQAAFEFCQKSGHSEALSKVAMENFYKNSIEPVKRHINDFQGDNDVYFPEADADDILKIIRNELAGAAELGNFPEGALKQLNKLAEILTVGSQ